MNPPSGTSAEQFVQFYGQPAWQDWQRLLAHFELGDGFAFLVLTLPGAVGADICRRNLAEYLAKQGKKLEELPCTYYEEARRLPERLLDIQPESNLGGIWIGTVIPDSDPEMQHWQQAWRYGLAGLNEQRNPLRDRFGCPLVLVGAPWLQSLLRETAPDLWSIRTGVVLVTPSSETHEDRENVMQLEAGRSMVGEAAADPDYTLEQAGRLRGKPGLEKELATLLLRAGNGFYNHVRWLAAERCYREAAELFSQLSSKDSRSNLAGTLNNWSNVLSDLGRLEEALAKSEKAVQINAQLAQTRPDAFLSDLAASLNNLAIRLGNMGQREDALAKAEEAARIYAQLAQTRPDAFLSDLAMSLNNLAHRLSDLGRRKEALAKVEEAVRIYVQLAQTRPDAFLPSLAKALNNLANALSDLGQREEAMAKAEEAVRIYEQLAQTRPDAFLPGLAVSLGNLATALSRLGRREEALTKAEESARIYEQLAQTRPDAFLPDSAASLNILANSLGSLGRREEALAKVEKAVQIYAQLAQAHPDAILPDLAKAYGTQGTILLVMKKPLEASSVFAQAIKILAPFFKQTPGAYEKLVEALCQAYTKACTQSQTEPDKRLLDSLRLAATAKP